VWLAPEVMKDRIYTEKADIYSFGVMLYEMLTRKQFFEDERFFSKMEQRIIAGERPELPPCFPELEQLIRECWASEAELRPSFATITDKITAIMKYVVRVSVCVCACACVRACACVLSHP
jgi:serine/threonine protein kinase